MKTDEEKGNYKTESDEALEMLGKGYNSDPIPPTKFTSTLSGFTPAPDEIVKEFGFVTALVWGRTWRFCQMSDGVCRASLEKMAESLGMSERTIIRHLETLCDGGYLFDTTPNLKNKPHIYADTGKIRIRINMEATMTQSQRAMTESQCQGDRESVEESIKKEIKKQDSKPDLVDLELQKKAKQDGIEPALQAFERDMQTPGNWSWYPAKATQEKEWRELREFVGKLYAENPNCFSEYHTWRNQPYVKGAMSNRQIKNYPADFQASWSDYCAHSAMYPAKNQPPVSNVKRSTTVQYEADGTPITF